MGNKVIDGNIEWIKDADSGEVVGYKAADGADRYITGVTFDPVTGGIEFSTGGYAAKAPVALSGKLLAPGDSYGYGTGASSNSARMTSLVASALGLTETNIAVGGAVLERMFDQQIGSMPIAAGDLTAMMCGYNNVRYGGTNEENLTNYTTALVATLAWLGLPDTKKKFSQIDSSTLNSVDYTFGGTWTPSSNLKGVAAQSRCGATTVTPGDYAETTVTGDSVYVFMGAQQGFTTKFYVMIDGVRVGSTGVLNVAPAIALPDGGQVPQLTVHRFTGLSNGEHTVRVVHAGSAGQYLWFPGVAGFRKSDKDLAICVVSGPAMMTAAGYAQGGLSGSATATRLYQAQTQRAVDTLKNDGLFIRYVDIDAAIKISADMIIEDTVHAYDLWHYLASRQLIAGVTAQRPWF